MIRWCPHEIRVIKSIANDPVAPFKVHAARLGVTTGTFREYVRHIYNKLGVRGIVHLAVWGVLNGYRDGCVCIKVEGQRDGACVDEHDREPVSASH